MAQPARRLAAATLASATLALAASLAAHAQSAPTATQAFRLSAFGGATANFTGLSGGKNLSLTAGVDLGVRPFFSLFPALEVRGTYAIDKGQVDSQKNVLAGLALAKHFGALRPYADFLFGRGEIDYPNGYPAYNAPLVYEASISNILSPGAGVDLTLSPHFAVKADVQFQRYATPVTASGYLYSKPVTLGLVYRFDFNHAGFPTH